jgi:hypothetical protein
MTNNKWNPKNFDMFSESKMAILRKVKEHPPLQTLLLQYDLRTQWPDALGEIAAYCNIVVDGMYTQQELDRLEDILYRELSEASMVLVQTPMISKSIN